MAEHKKPDDPPHKAEHHKAADHKAEPKAEPKAEEKPPVEPPKKRPTGPAPSPGSKELESLREAKFGTKPGAIQVDADDATGKTVLVYVDGTGNIISREGYRPKAEG